MIYRYPPPEDEIASWDFVRAVSAHFDCPLQLKPKDFREVFSFLLPRGKGS